MPAIKLDFCIRGHTRTPENMYANRSCKLCQRERTRQYQKTPAGKATRKRHFLTERYAQTIKAYLAKPETKKLFNTYIERKKAKLALKPPPPEPKPVLWVDLKTTRPDEFMMLKTQYEARENGNRYI